MATLNAKKGYGPIGVAYAKMIFRTLIKILSHEYNYLGYKVLNLKI